MTDPFPVTWADPAEADLSWEWEEMHCPRALPPLAGDYFTTGIIPGLNYRFERFGLPVRYLSRQINGYVFVGERLDPGADRQALGSQAREGRRAQSLVVRRYWDEKVYPVLMETYAWIAGVPVETAPPAEVAAAWDDLWRRVPQLYRLHFMTNAGSYQSLDSLADFYESVVEGARPGDALRLVQGLPNELQRVQRGLYLLTERARSSPAVAGRITADPHTALTHIAEVEGGPQFLDALEEFLRAHGHLGQSHDDLSLPSWADEPSLVLIEVRKRLLSPEEDPDVRRRQLAADADALADQVRARLKDRPEDLQQFERLLAHAKDVGPLTEGHNYWLDRMLQAHAHRFAMRVGRRLAELGVIGGAGDVFFLHAAEISEALHSPRDLRPFVVERRAALQRWGAIRPPKYLGRPPELSSPSGRFDAPPPEQTDATVLRGTGASPGKTRGPARVVISSDEMDRVQRGDVLVCPASNPSWVPLFGIISALVTNTGGVLSHAAVVAREFGVPAVVGTGEATLRLRDGQWVEVDGTAGEVRIL